jgi:hypothetical protein
MGAALVAFCHHPHFEPSDESSVFAAHCIPSTPEPSFAGRDTAASDEQARLAVAHGRIDLPMTW